MTLALIAALALTADAAAYTPGDAAPEGERVGMVLLKPDETRPIQSQELYVLGWSKNGKLAYVVSDDTGESGNRRYHFVLTNLRTDKRVASADATVPGDNPPTVVETLTKQKAFLAALNANAIVPDPNADLSWAPVKVGDSTVDVSVEQTPASEPDDFGRTHVARWSVILKGDQGKKKVFETSREGTGPDAGPLQVGFMGYFRSPHEARIAIVLGEEHASIEGTTIVDLRVIGAALTTGFKK